MLDLVFACDCTSSMGPYIENAKANIRNIMSRVAASDKGKDLRLAVVSYRDHPPQDPTFVTKCLDFTSSVDKAQRFVKEMSPYGGLS
jgi:hypothetical protein